MAVIDTVAYYCRLVLGAMRRKAGLMERPQTTRQLLGKRGEDAAAKLLKRKGLKVVCRNWRCGEHEIDLVCREGRQVVFVEVRTRSEGAAVGGLASVTQKKRKSQRRAINSYLRGRQASWRFDVVEVSAGADGLEVRHFERCDLPS